MTTTAELAEKAHLVAKKGDSGASYTFTQGQLEEFRRLVEDSFVESILQAKNGNKPSPFGGCGGACKKADHD